MFGVTDFWEHFGKEYPQSKTLVGAVRVPPPRWTPPTRRGRLSKEMKRLMAQWST